MLNQAIVNQILAQARAIEHERASFIKESDFYAIRDVLFAAVTGLDQESDSMVALELGTAAQIVEYIERTEELIPAMLQVIWAMAFGTAPTSWLAHLQPGAFQ